ncbi:hypothetical protein BVRB_5g111500 isoform B [Beta vulgaris subsp. vulgaris]|nr:hypothetical protein BVRB_5g111500 isoform B [Beta vulgaris subsp. vulgaris]
MRLGESMYVYKVVTLSMGIYVALWKLLMFQWQIHLPEDDIRHWTKFPSFAPLLNQVEVDGGKSLDLNNYPYIFMRWKEQYFVNVGTDCGLTIAGFYYVCFSCSDGSINGFYYDPNSSPFQKLELKSSNEGRSGFSFSSYELQ